MRDPNLVTLPTIIDGLGEYLTRNGRTVVVTMIEKGAYAAYGYYKTDGTREHWDISGRTLPFTENNNDVVRKAE